jgi:predicted RNA binding protein YcfA (HicA-like mRNA interferase family)
MAVARSRRRELWDRLAAGDLRNVGFTEFRRLIEAFGFRLRQVSGSHHIYTHPEVPRPLSLQPHRREAKPYQIRQFLEMVHTFGLTMERRQ